MPNQAVVQRPDGSTYEVPIGTQFRMSPGEHVIGKRVVAMSLLEETHSPEGLGIGDAIAWITKKIGIQPCAPCNRRRKQLNKYRIRL